MRAMRALPVAKSISRRRVLFGYIAAGNIAPEAQGLYAALTTRQAEPTRHLLVVARRETLHRVR